MEKPYFCSVVEQVISSSWYLDGQKILRQIRRQQRSSDSVNCGPGRPQRTFKRDLTRIFPRVKGQDHEAHGGRLFEAAFRVVIRCHFCGTGGVKVGHAQVQRLKSELLGRSTSPLDS